MARRTRSVADSFRQAVWDGKCHSVAIPPSPAASAIAIGAGGYLPQLRGWCLHGPSGAASRSFHGPRMVVPTLVVRRPQASWASGPSADPFERQFDEPSFDDEVGREGASHVPGGNADGEISGTVSKNRKRDRKRALQVSEDPAGGPTVAGSLAVPNVMPPKVSAPDGAYALEEKGNQVPAPSSRASSSPIIAREDKRLVDGEARVEAAMTHSPHLLSMPPSRLALQQDLTRAHSTSSVLALCAPEEVAAMDAVNVATAVHRLAKLCKGGHERSLVAVHPRLSNLLAAVPDKLAEMSPRGLANILWAVVQLDCVSEWTPQLLVACIERHEHFRARDLSATLTCVAKSRSLQDIPASEAFRGAALATLSSKLPELETPTDLACAATAFARLAHREEPVFAEIAQISVNMLDAFEADDIAALMWAFAHLNFSHSTLFNRIIDWLKQNIDGCSPSIIVNITWAFSRAKFGDEALFLDILAPVIRTKMLEFDAPRSLCTIAWSYSNAGMQDEALFNDIAHVLTPKVKFMNAHDVASVVVALASIEYAHKRLFTALVKHTRSIVHTFSPLQVSRTIYGFGTSGVQDEPLYRALSQRLLQNRKHLHIKNVVEAVGGLVEAGYTPPKVVGTLLQEVEKSSAWLAAQDAIHLLHSIAMLPDGTLRGEVSQEALVLKLTDTLHRRSQGWWRFKPHEMADLLEAIANLEIDDPVLLESICRQFHRLTKPGACDVATFLRLWGAMAELPSEGRHVFVRYLHRREKIVESFSEQISIATKTLAVKGDQMHNMAALLYACARLGIDGEPMEAIADFVLRSGTGSTASARSEDWWSMFLWGAAELGHGKPFADGCAARWLEAQVDACEVKAGMECSTPCEQTAEFVAMLRGAWACAVMSGAPERDLWRRIGLLIAARKAEVGAKLAPDVRRMMQQVSLECQVQARCASDGGMDARRMSPPDAPMAGSWSDLNSRGTRVEKHRTREEDEWVSKALQKLRVAHDSAATLGGGSYQVAAALREGTGKTAVVVMGATDHSLPSRELLGEARLMKLHLQALGWRIAEVSLKEAESAEQAGTLAELLGTRIA